MGKNKSKTQSTETIAPSAAYAPYINAGAESLRPGFEQAQGQVQSLLPKLNQGVDYFSDVLGGKFLNSNPYLQSVLDASNRDITSTVDSRFSSAGRYGSGAHQGVLARAIGDNEARLRYGDYQAERGYMNEAPRNLAGMVTSAVTLPQLPASQYADGLSSLLGKYVTGTGQSTTTHKQGVGGVLGGVLGAGLSGWASGGFKGI